MDCCWACLTSWLCRSQWEAPDAQSLNGQVLCLYQGPITCQELFLKGHALIYTDGMSLLQSPRDLPLDSLTETYISSIVYLFQHHRICRILWLKKQGWLHHGLDLLLLAPFKPFWSLNIWAGTILLDVECIISITQRSLPCAVFSFIWLGMQYIVIYLLLWKWHAGKPLTTGP